MESNHNPCLMCDLITKQCSNFNGDSPRRYVWIMGDKLAAVLHSVVHRMNYTHIETFLHNPPRKYIKYLMQASP